MGGHEAAPWGVKPSFSGLGSEGQNAGRRSESPSDDAARGMSREHMSKGTEFGSSGGPGGLKSSTSHHPYRSIKPCGLRQLLENWSTFN